MVTKDESVTLPQLGVGDITQPLSVFARLQLKIQMAANMGHPLQLPRITVNKGKPS